ncbi:hypothetical protein Tcan_04123 [Toxocara canis]|uniref:Uncharacterized protein n=1 Tax=Toxocara canis TaxID=6265 RepID=A0A0B2VV11_TOXCA|nr:hypothetical protein Tcan_04123 [Toxocara canis]
MFKRRPSRCAPVTCSSGDCGTQNAVIGDKRVLIDRRQHLVIDQLGEGSSSKPQPVFTYCCTSRLANNIAL